MTENFQSYDDIASDYLTRFAKDAAQESEWFGPRARTLEVAIKRACLSELPAGRGKAMVRHSHQRRIPRQVLAEAFAFLSARSEEISAVGSFSELHDLVDRTIRPIPGVGELLVYDVSHRLGAFLAKEPAEVHLHAGTRAGARALGVNTSNATVPKKELPKGLQHLSAAQLEDVLCLYKDRFSNVGDSSGHSHNELKNCQMVKGC